jgi:drug/metabolite transporter (DMT)-like permease
MSGPTLARRDLLALTLAAAAWGIGTVISKRAVDEIPPLTLLPIQLAASLATLAVLMWRRGVSIRAAQPAILGRLGVLNPGIAYALSLLGLAYISASLSVLLWALEPLLILALAAVFLRERVTPGLVVLSLIAVAGMVLVIYEPAVGGGAIGVALTVAGVGCCAVYTIISRRFMPGADGTAPVVFAQQAYALGFALLVIIAIALAGGQVRPESVSPLGLASAVTSGVLYYAAAYWLYLSALRAVPASIAAVSFYLIPIFGVAGAYLLLGERLDARQWVGAVVVLVAVFAIIRPRAASSAESVASPLPTP